MRIIAVLALLYVFLVGIKMMGGGCKALAAGEDSFARRLISQTDNPFIGLFVGLLVTSIIQSSGVTSSTVVALVAAGVLSIRQAVPIVMGANIGTTVTNILVSMGYVTRKEEFRRAISAAVVHDLFNVMTVVLLLPIELIFRATVGVGLLEGIAARLAVPLSRLGGIGDVESCNLLEPVLRPALSFLASIIGTPKGPGWTAGITAIVGLVFIFAAILSFVKILRSMMLTRAESALSKAIGRSGWRGILIGTVVAATIHSSSVTTALMVPLAAAGIVTVAQVFPVTLGANIGTTFTALVASMATSVTGVTIALVHTVFNILGIVIFYPVPAVRRIPIRLAERVGALAERSRKTVIIGAAAIFYGIPCLLILLSRLLSKS